MVICKEHACEKKCENPRETIPVDVYARGRYLNMMDVWLFETLVSYYQCKVNVRHIY